MGKILLFPERRPPKFGFERVRKGRKENPDQMNLFSAKMGKILRLPTNIGPFEEALLLDECNDNRAEQAYRRAISEGEQAADAYCNLGIIESRGGRIASAFDCFTKSLEHDPRHFESHYNLGNLYFDGDNMRLAKMHYELAVKINPEFPNLYFNLGLVLVLLEDKKGALEAFVRYKSLAPPDERRNADELIRKLKRGTAGM